MCLGIPGKVIEIYQSDFDTANPALGAGFAGNGVLMGKVDFGGLVKEVCLAYVPTIVVGDYCIVHVGFAISQLDEESAQETLALLRQIGSFDDEFGREMACEKGREQDREAEEEGRHALSR